MQNIQAYKIRRIKKIAFFVTLFYLLLMFMVEGIKPEHIAITVVYNFCIWLNPKTRKFVLAFTIFIVFALLYDIMKVYPNYIVNPVDITQIYNFEKIVFGFNSNGVRITPNEFFAIHHHSLTDIVAGLFYINWIPIPLSFAFWSYLYNKELFLHFSLTFFLVNLLGFCIYYIYPAAPPWYVDLYGFSLHINVQGNTAGLERFDNLVHIPVFESIYSRNSNVFAAMPSLHCAYPVVVLYYAIRSRMGKINWIFGIFMAGIWFSAVYSGHHYIFDVIAGIFCAIIGILIFKKILLKMPIFQKWLAKYSMLIS